MRVDTARGWTRWRASLIAQEGLVFCGDRPKGAPATNDSLCQAQGLKTLGHTLDHIQRVTGGHVEQIPDLSGGQIHPVDDLGVFFREPHSHALAPLV